MQTDDFSKHLSLAASYLSRGQNKTLDFWITWPVTWKRLIFGLTLFRHWFHQLAIFRNKFVLILTLPGSVYTPLQINTCFMPAMKIPRESATFGQR